LNVFTSCFFTFAVVSLVPCEIPPFITRQFALVCCYHLHVLHAYLWSKQRGLAQYTLNLYTTRAQQYLRWATVATIDMGRKEGGGCCAPFAGELSLRLTKCGLGRGPLPYQVTSSFIQPFGHNRPETENWGAVPLLGGAATPSNTTSLGLRFTSVPSRSLIHPAFGHNKHRPKIGWGCSFFSGGNWVPI